MDHVSRKLRPFVYIKCISSLKGQWIWTPESFISCWMKSDPSSSREESCKSCNSNKKQSSYQTIVYHSCNWLVYSCKRRINYGDAFSLTSQGKDHSCNDSCIYDGKHFLIDVINGHLLTQMIRKVHGNWSQLSIFYFQKSIVDFYSKHWEIWSLVI